MNLTDMPKNAAIVQRHGSRLGAVSILFGYHLLHEHEIIYVECAVLVDISIGYSAMIETVPPDFSIVAASSSASDLLIPVAISTGSALTMLCASLRLHPR